MSYATGEAAALTLLQALSAWGTENSVSVANDQTGVARTLINSGADYKYLILAPGPFESEFRSIADNFVMTTWLTRINLIVFDEPSGSSFVPAEYNLSRLRDEIMNTLDVRLNLQSASVVNRAKVTVGEEIDQWKTAGANPKPFLVQELTLTWEEAEIITQAD